MMRRNLIAAGLLWLACGIASAQPTLPPVLLPPTVAPPSSPTHTLTFTITPSLTATRTATPTPTETIDPLITLEPFEIDVITDVLFPSGVGLRIGFNFPETGLESIRLSVSQDGWEGDSVEIGTETLFSDENGLSNLTYLWSLPTVPPRLFEPLAFVVEIVPRGRPSESFEFETAFADPRIVWSVQQSKDAPVTFALPEGRTAASVALAQISTLATLLDAAERDISPLKAVIFPSSTSASLCNADDTVTGPETGLIAPCTLALADALYALGLWQPLLTSASEPAQTVLARAILSGAYPDLFLSDSVPDWFKSGLVAYFSGSYSPSDLASARAASRSNLLLSSLEIAPRSFAETAQWKAQSTGLLVYMASRIGVRPLLALIDRIDAGEPLRLVWAELSGQELDALPFAWRSWIFTPQGEAGYSVLPNLDPTPTLVPTRTATATSTPTSTFTPTSTPRFTATATDTAVPTPTNPGGFEPPTAAPTALPSVTPPPTVTALPAQEFTLGEIPGDPQPTPDNTLTTILLVFAGAGAVIALAVIVIILFRRR